MMNNHSRSLLMVLLLFQVLCAIGLVAQTEPESTTDIPLATAAPTDQAGSTDRDTPAPTPWTAEIDYLLGSLRIPYSSVISGLKVRFPASDSLPLALDFHLESQGTFIALNPQAFELSGCLVWEALRSPEGSGLGLGLGGTFWGRFASLTDVRSTAVSGFAPFLRFQGRASLLNGEVDLDLGAAADLSIFTDGLSVSLNPVLGLGISWFRASLEFRGTALMRVFGEARNTPDSELRMDTFLCLGVRIP